MRDGCDFCGADAVDTVNEAGPPCLTGDFRIVDGVIHNVMCRTCGTVWNRRMMDHAALDAFYTGYTKKTDEAREDDLLFDPMGGVETLGRNQVAFLERVLPRDRPGRILDVGCGKGALLGLFNDAFPGWTRIGVEPSAAAAAIARLDPSLTVHDGVLDTAEIEPDSIDVVTIVHVLEHTPSPSAALRAMHRALRPGGLLFVEVPNMLDPNMFYDFLLHEHLFHFSTGTLQRLLVRHGFEIAAVEPSTSYGAQRVIGRKTRGEQAIDLGSAAALTGQLRDGLASWRRFWDQMRDAALQLANASAAGKRVALFGAGMTTAVALVYTELRDAGIVALFDENPWKLGRTYFGRRIHPLEDAAALGVEVVGIATMPGSQQFVRRKLAAWEAQGIELVCLADDRVS